MTLSTKQQYRINSLVTGVLLIAIAALLAWLSVRYSFNEDLTRSGRHSLSTASIKVLEQLDEPLVVTAYAREQAELHEAIRQFVDKYRQAKQDIELKFVNIDTNPDEVRELGIQTNGELVLHYKGRTEHIRSASEQEFTNTIQRLLRNSERWLAFVEGHGERNPLGKANHDLGEFVQQLSLRGFRFQSLNLGADSFIPDNTSALIIASPLVEVLPGEIERIVEYVDKGGNLLWLVDPGDKSNLNALAKLLNIRIPDGTIIDYAGQLIGINDPTISMITSRLYGAHPLLEEFSYTTLFPGAVSITAKTDSTWTNTALLNTGTHTWLETGKLEGNVVYDEGLDQLGPLSIGLALERAIEQQKGEGIITKQQRVLVIGDGDFLSNTYIGNTGNMELGVRLINWLSSDDDLISIPAHVAEDTQLEMNAWLAGSLGLFFLLGLPLILTATGLTFWWRRKNS